MFSYRLEHIDRRNVTDSSSNVGFGESVSPSLTLFAVFMLFSFLFEVFRWFFIFFFVCIQVIMRLCMFHVLSSTLNLVIWECELSNNMYEFFGQGKEILALFSPILKRDTFAFKDSTSCTLTTDWLTVSKIQKP